MSDFTLNFAQQVQQKTELSGAFVYALTNLVNSPNFGGDEIADLYKNTLHSMRSELNRKSNKCDDILSSVDLDERDSGAIFLAESDTMSNYYNNSPDLLNL